MAYVRFPNYGGLFVVPFDFHIETNAPGLGTTINAVGESASYIGRIHLTSGPGTSKTISSGGGKIYFMTGAVTWASGSTNLRVGIQDVVGASGLEDGTFDVYDDLIPGTDTLVATSVKEVILTNGTKTITHGDMIAISIEMTARGGTDSVVVQSESLGSILPYHTVDTGVGPTKGSNFIPITCILTDDGTLGFFGSEFFVPLTKTTQAFGSTTSPDEYGILFQLPFKCKINAIYVKLGTIGTSATGNLCIISDPLGTPSDLLSAATDTSVGLASVGYYVQQITETELLANTNYAITYRPTTNTSRNINLLNLVSADLRKATVFGTNLVGVSRTDLGAFTQSTTVIADIGFRISSLDDGSGGGETSVAYV